jgi:hypothetical protein
VNSRFYRAFVWACVIAALVVTVFGLAITVDAIRQGDLRAEVAKQCLDLGYIDHRVLRDGSAYCISGDTVFPLERSD